eukprot:10165570-Alexandrium_andersonii.AAC.1
MEGVSASELVASWADNTVWHACLEVEHCLGSTAWPRRAHARASAGRPQSSGNADVVYRVDTRCRVNCCGACGHPCSLTRCARPWTSAD